MVGDFARYFFLARTACREERKSYASQAASQQATKKSEKVPSPPAAGGGGGGGWGLFFSLALGSQRVRTSLGHI